MQVRKEKNKITTKIMKIFITYIIFALFVNSEIKCQSNFTYMLLLKDSQSKERVKLSDCEIFVFYKGGFLQRQNNTTDRNGLIIFESSKIIDSLILTINPPYEYCSLKTSTQQTINLPVKSNKDTLNINIDFFSATTSFKKSFYFQPFTLNCINNFNDENETEKPCYCLYNDECKYLSSLIELLKCNQNFIVDIEGNTSEAEYQFCKDSLIKIRVNNVMKILKSNRIEDSRINIVVHGKSKPILNETEIKKSKSKSEQAELFNLNTYIKINIRRRWS